MKAVGVTESERFLAQLCERTFLSLWSYPGIFRDQGVGKTGEGKEICDLLVVFDEHVLIFSDKHCAFPAKGDVNVGWGRWFKKSIRAAADQLWGAERWIRDYPDRLFLDRACKQRFPVPLPPPNDAVFHLIVVAHGSQERAQKVIGGAGSLILESSLKGQDHLAKPFTVGDLDERRTFVHVFDDVSLPIVLSTVDTIADFVRYLQKKAAFVRSPVEVLARSEADLLALYLKTTDRAGEHDFPSSQDAEFVVVDEGHWDDFESRPERIAQRRANQVSYSWDALIQEFAHHTLAGTHDFAVPPTFETSNTILKFLAREPRTRRRMLAGALLEALHDSNDHERRTRYILPSRSGDPFYVFLFLPVLGSRSREEYRQTRLKVLQACCLVVRLKHPEAQDIVGIATESGVHSIGRSEDAAYFDGRTWTAEDEAAARDAQQRLDLLTNPVMSRRSVDEYPVAHQRTTVGPVLKGNARNLPCPCGSGAKYKRCHGAAT